jgi:lipopolysaccharide biosynthesis glycosyltransferase
MMTISFEKAFVTAITRDSYLRGAQTLAKSLQMSGSKMPLIVLYTLTVSQDTVTKLSEFPNIQVRPIQPYKLDKFQKGISNYAFERFAEAWTKLRCWELIDVGVLCWLDADMLITQNMDEIFDLLPQDKELGACPTCICNPSKVEAYPKWWVPENCPYSGTTDPSLSYFNAGLLLFRPSLKTLEKLEAYVSAKKDLTEWIFAEQDFLNEYYRGAYHRLPIIYNAIKTLSTQHPKMWDMKAIKNIHYVLEKPWDDKESKSSKLAPYKKLNDLWWKVYDLVGRP